VLVVDWGFAKVLAHGGVADERLARQEHREITMIATVRSAGEGSQSIAGSVMGTPAYMPPEQAMGQIDALDERSDVFALGAILTEILTGSPPYVGEPEDQLVMAAQAKLDDAHDRLDRCGADPELVALAKACLSSLRRDRPRDAGVLAGKVSMHLTAVAERARRSKVAAVEAKEAGAKARAETAELRARAEAERAQAEAQRTKAEEARHRAEAARAAREEMRKRRRQSLSIAAAVLAAILVGVGGWAFVDAGRQARARRVARDVEAKLREVTGHSEAGRLDAAVAAAEQAVDLAAAGGAPGDLRHRAEAALADGRARREERKRDDAMLARLERAFLDGEPDVPAAIREYGIDLGMLSPEVAGREIARRRIAAELVTALDAWALSDPGRAAGRLSVSDAADADPDRRRIRAALREEDVRPLLEMADGDLRGKPARTFELLALALRACREEYRAIDVFERGWVDHPGDFRIHVHLARALSKQDRPEWRRVAAHYAAAFVLRPARTDLRDQREAALGKAYEPLIATGGLGPPAWLEEIAK
jgi:hypothetical protein